VRGESAYPLNGDTLLFFNDHPGALALYARFEEMLLERFPETGKRVQKTQITFTHRHVYACVSFARVRRKAELPEDYIVVTLGLPGPIGSDRVAVKTEAYPGRWTHHLVIRRAEELDEELFGWLGEAYAFAGRKR